MARRKAYGTRQRSRSGTSTYEEAVAAVRDLLLEPLPASILSADRGRHRTHAISEHFGQHPVIIDAARWKVTHATAHLCPGNHVGSRPCDPFNHNAPLHINHRYVEYIAAQVDLGRTERAAHADNPGLAALYGIRRANVPAPTPADSPAPF